MNPNFIIALADTLLPGGELENGVVAPSGAEILPCHAEAAGASHIWAQEIHRQKRGAHLLGTCRMGDDPATSVVDRKGRCHHVGNVVVADGSLFPTSGAVNPASTIGALALHLADNLAGDLT